jgi:archaellum component FlaC
MTTLQNYYLVTKSSRDFEGELFVNKVKLDNTTDEATRRDYEESRRMLEEQTKNFQQISTLLDRVEAQLSIISSTIDNTLADTIRIQALRPEDISRELHQLLKPIQAQSEQLAIFEKEAASSKL